jgi:anti-sigma regulatory factor (Ser/Thr protein kinase)
MVIHADGGTADVEVYPDRIVMVLEDHGPGIPDVELAMKEGYSTATEQIHNMGFGAGMGLPNMKRSSDDLKIETKVGVGTKITMVVRL